MAARPTPSVPPLDGYGRIAEDGPPQQSCTWSACLIAYFGGRRVFVIQQSSEGLIAQSSPSNMLGDTLANHPVALRFYSRCLSSSKIYDTDYMIIVALVRDPLLQRLFKSLEC